MTITATEELPVIPRLSSRTIRAAAALALPVLAVAGFAVGRSTAGNTPTANTAPTTLVGPATPADVQRSLTPGQGFTP